MAGSLKIEKQRLSVVKYMFCVLLQLVFTVHSIGQLSATNTADTILPDRAVQRLVDKLDLVSSQMSLNQYREGLVTIEEVLNEMEFKDNIPDFYRIDAWIKAASLYSLLDELDNAMSMCQKALSRSKDCFGEDNEQYAQSLDMLSFIYYQRGDIGKALLYGQQSCELFQRLPNTLNYVYALNDLAAYYFDNGNYEDAIDIGLMVQSKALTELGSHDSFYVNSLNNLARFYAGVGDYENAIVYSEEALRICKESGLGRSYSHARSLEHLANYYYEQSEYQQAISYAEEALPMFESLFGDSSFEYINVMRDITRFYIRTEEYAKAASCIVDIEKKIEKAIISVFSSMSSKERAMYWNWYNKWYYFDLPSYCYTIGSDEVLAVLYNACLFSKGLLLHADIEERRTKNNDESNSSNQFSFYASLEQSQSVRWEDVRKCLKDKEIAIEFVKIEDETDCYYAALTLKKDYVAPRFTKLFSFGDFCSIDNGTYFREPLLGDLVWGKLSEEFSDVENVFFSTTGILHAVGIEYLPWKQSGCISDSLNMYRLTTTRELLKRDRGLRHGTTALFGGLDYNHSEEISDCTVKEEADAISLDLYRGIAERGGFNAIPQSLNEVMTISDVLSKSYSNCQLYTDEFGTESSFRALSGSSVNIIHLATHGDYIPFSKTSENHQIISSNLIDSDGHSYTKEDLAMIRSFIVFSGANVLLDSISEAPNSDNDGVLTAFEVADLTFNDLDLVVLSACNTGLGELSEDGVIGLQRGFKKAGARSMIMSLWKVADEPTMFLMTCFYQFLAEGDGIKNAFSKAQSMLKQQYGTSGERPYWASFILLDAF